MSMVILAKKTKILNSRFKGDNSNKGYRNGSNMIYSNNKNNHECLHTNNQVYTTVSSSSGYIKSKRNEHNHTKKHITSTYDDYIVRQKNKVNVTQNNDSDTQTICVGQQPFKTQNEVIEGLKTHLLCINEDKYIKNTIC
jgi:hypothetical protein